MLRYPIIFTELCFLCEQFVNLGVASFISLVFAFGKTSIIPLLRLSPPNPLSLGFGGDPFYGVAILFTDTSGFLPPPTHRSGYCTHSPRGL
jgi:hypothetical protein